MVRLKSKNYKKEYHILTKLYQEAEDLLKKINLSAQEHGITSIYFLDEDEDGFSKLNKIYGQRRIYDTGCQKKLNKNSQKPIE